MSPDPDDPHLPHPRGPLSGRRNRLRRKLGYLIGAISAKLYHTPPGRLFHRRLMEEVELNEVEVRLTRGGTGLDGLLVAFLSDVHAGNFMTADDLLVLARRVMARAPDLICLGGDLINTRLEELSWYSRALDELRAPLGLFAVPGNHEYYDLGIPPMWRAWLEQQGVEVLWNRGKRVGRNGSSLWLGGVDDLTEGEPDPAAALDGRRPDEPALLLSHHPDVFVEAARLGADLQLSGHTHGGQIKIFGRAPIVHSAHGYLEGLHRRGEAWLYVGRGVGVTVFPIRWGARAEIVLVRLRTT